MPFSGSAPGTDPVLGCFPVRVGSLTGGFSSFGSLDLDFGILLSSPESSTGFVRISGVEMSDNSAMVAYFRKSWRGTLVPSLCQPKQGRFCNGAEAFPFLCPVSVPGHRTVITDVLSWDRVGSQWSEWTLHP